MGRWGPSFLGMMLCQVEPSLGQSWGSGGSVELWDPMQGGAGLPPALFPDPLPHWEMQASGPGWACR